MISIFESPILPAPPEARDVKETLEATGEPVRVKKDYFSKGTSEMSVFTDDDHLQVLDDADQHWWLLKDARSGQVGFVPACYVQSMDEILATANAFQNLSIKADPESLVRLKAAPLDRTKRVSFSDEEPIEHLIERIEYEDDEELWPLNDYEDEGDAEEAVKGSSFLQSALIDEAVRKALGIDGSPKAEKNAAVVHVESAKRAEEGRIFPSDDFVSSQERLELPSSTQQTKPSLLSRLLSPLLRSQDAFKDQAGLVKVFAGNFAAIPAYKTCIMNDDSSMLELENVAKKLYRIEEADDDYELTLVHDQSLHVMPVQSSFSLGTLTEIAKVATIEDGLLLDAKGKPVSRHRKKVPRSHLIVIRKRKQNISIRGIKSGFLADPELVRHKGSDFPTNYRFVLNMKVAPFVRKQFYIWVELETGSREEQQASRIALAVKALTTVEEIIDRSCASMEIAPMDGVSYELVLGIQTAYIHQYRFESKDGREVLTREMTVNDVRNQWSHIDSSGFLFLLRPFVRIGSEFTDT